ncbi:MAG: succinylglutamate desuccinylase/aspartoacylase family protein [bacterium]|nr:succinylglutamate desuccinylase/aspartoacylase family protein [bacterium]
MSEKKILLTIMTHGDEHIGKKVAGEVIRRHPNIIGKGLDVNIANEKAYREKKRYIDLDLNRVFPGNTTGSYEEQRALELSSIISSYDLVIDIHSTESGSGDMIIVTKLDSATKEIIDILNPKYVLLMNIKPDKSLISSARIGLAFEMGSDDDKETLAKTLVGIERILSYFKLIPNRESYGFKTEYFEVFKQMSKPAGARLEHHIKNFSLIKKGEIFARNIDNSPIIAEFDFYPVIFGSTNYETIFGFAAREIYPAQF